uniref:Uncharacterized protein n=1 Tax=Romanomermis culicivorax TaxID=13658 RepID=A0A915KYM8_ROMCU
MMSSMAETENEYKIKPNIFLLMESTRAGFVKAVTDAKGSLLWASDEFGAVLGKTVSSDYGEWNRVRGTLNNFYSVLSRHVEHDDTVSRFKEAEEAMMLIYTCKWRSLWYSCNM